MDNVIAFPTPESPFRQIGLSYSYEPAHLQVIFRADYLKRHGEELHGVLTVETTRPGMKPHLHEASHNFSSMASRGTVAKYLSMFASDIDWRREMETFCVSVMRHHRLGDPMVLVGQCPDTLSEPDLLTTLLPHKRITWLFGEEGAGKGTLAVAWMVGIASGQGFMHFPARQGRVAYLDWEDDADSMDHRIKAVCRGLDIAAPEVLYRRCRGPLSASLHGCAQQFETYGVDAYVVDSAILASGVGSEHGDAADSAHGLVDALNILNRTVLVIDHVAKNEALNGRLPARPYGSVMKRAWARQAWEIRKDQEPGRREFTIGLYHNKFNHGSLQPPLGIKVMWSEDSQAVTFAKTDVRESPILMQGGTLASQIENILTHDPGLTIAEVAATLGVGVKDDSVRRTLERHEGKKFLRVSDGWACLARTYAS